MELTKCPAGGELAQKGKEQSLLKYEDLLLGPKAKRLTSRERWVHRALNTQKKGYSRSNTWGLRATRTYVGVEPGYETRVKP